MISVKKNKIHFEYPNFASQISQILSLILLWRRSLSYRNHSIDLHSKSMGWFLYDSDLRINIRCEIRRRTLIGMNKIFSIIFVLLTNFRCLGTNWLNILSICGGDNTCLKLSHLFKCFYTGVINISTKIALPVSRFTILRRIVLDRFIHFCLFLVLNL